MWWVEAKYVHIAPSERSKGIDLPALFRAYKAAKPRVHVDKLDKWQFAHMMWELYPGIDSGVGHRNGPYLLQSRPIVSLFC
jgi:hypothetical protein